jgi:uncharacterized protein (TIGR03437 family)
MRAALLLFLFAFAVPYRATAHAPVLPPIQGPLQTRGSLIVDGAGAVTQLLGVHMPGLEALDPEAGSIEAGNVAAMTYATFGVIRLRWNMNTVRLPVSVRAWRRDGVAYLDRVAAVVRLANDAELAVVLVACEDARSGSTAANGLPSADTVSFWRVWSDRFKDNPRVIFSVFRQPSARSVPGATSATRTAADWNFWRNGGVAADGQRAAGMQELVDTIRSTGAQQLVAVSAFHDTLGFQGLTADNLISGPNILYERDPYYDFGLGNAERDASFGFLAGRVPLYAGEWGLTLRDNGPGCRSLPRDPQSVATILFDTVTYFTIHQISWTASSFQPSGLAANFDDYAPTSLDRLWTCGEMANPQPGMGEVLTLSTTGDPFGFGALRADQIANSAGGPAAPVAPGELVTIYAEQLGPAAGLGAQFDADGRLPVKLGETEVWFDGVPAPILFAGAFQINVQAPYSLQPGKTTSVQGFFYRIPSNRLTVDVVDAAPEVFNDFATHYAISLNEDGSRNGPTNPANAGGIVVLFASGGGQTSPAGITGAATRSPHPQITLPVTLTVEGQPTEILFAGEVPGFVGLVQVNARLARSSTPAAAPRPVPISLRIGSRSNRAPVLIWIR